MLKKVIAFSFAVISMLSVQAFAMEPYHNYTYDSNQKVWTEPQAYYADGCITGNDLGIGSFKSPSDIFVSKDQKIYIADAGNNRIVVLKPDRTLDRILQSFSNKGKTDKFSSPQGVFVTKDNQVYVADTGNKRVVIFAADGSFQRAVEQPEFRVKQKFDYSPFRISVDDAGRMFITSKNVNYGMIELDKDGNFVSFFGAIEVTPSVGDALWRRIATQKQLDKMKQNVPTEYSSNAVDDEGFIYGTISTQDAEHFVRKLNALGTDVLRRMGSVDPDGDVQAFDDKTNRIRSSLVDITVGGNGIYSVLDARQGRVFTYDNDGNLMYVFGAIGTQKGCFTQPVALDVTQDQTYLVLDQSANRVISFEPTEYAQKINAAVGLQFQRDYKGAEKIWVEMLKYSAKSEMVYNEIGKAYYRQAKYQKAMNYFKKSYNKEQYSKAYKESRRITMNNSFGLVMSILAAIVIGAVVLWLVLRRRKKARAKE